MTMMWLVIIHTENLGSSTQEVNEDVTMLLDMRCICKLQLNFCLLLNASKYNFVMILPTIIFGLCLKSLLWEKRHKT